MILLATAVAATGCGEAEMEEVPETAEVEVEPMEGETELEEETVLGMDDVGEIIMATGWVTGVPLESGFFLRTEDDRVIFVETEDDVTPGQVVRVVGPLVASRVMMFEEWEADAFEAGFEAEWNVETALYIDAASVTPM